MKENVVLFYGLLQEKRTWIDFGMDLVSRKKASKIFTGTNICKLTVPCH